MLGGAGTQMLGLSFGGNNGPVTENLMGNNGLILGKFKYC